MTIDPAKLAHSIMVRLGRCYRACFVDGATGEPTLEGNRVLADLRHFAFMDRHLFVRDLRGALDPIGMGRIEGRREVVRRLEGFLNLDERTVRQLVEVKDE